jgi:hypothetical protein
VQTLPQLLPPAEIGTAQQEFPVTTSNQVMEVLTELQFRTELLISDEHSRGNDITFQQALDSSFAQYWNECLDQS